MNNYAIIGRLTRDPELRYIKGSGAAVTNFTVAVDKKLSKEKKLEMENQGKYTADFIPVTAWNKTAEAAANYLAKGRLVGVVGRIETGSYTNDKGDRVNTFTLVAESIDFLEWGDNNNNNQNQNQNQNNYQDSGYNPNNNYNEQNNNTYQDTGFMPVDNDDIPF